MKEAGVLPNMVMVFGQMNEPPGSRFRVGHAALTVAEYFRDDEHRDVRLLSCLLGFVIARVIVMRLICRSAAPGSLLSKPCAASVGDTCLPNPDAGEPRHAS